MSTVREAMVRRPKVCDESTTVATARMMFADDHVHALLIVRDAHLTSVVERDDLAGARAGALALSFGRLHGRTVGAGDDSEHTRKLMLRAGVRRLAVVDVAGNLLGLLCLKRSRTGFCSDADVQARHDERVGSGHECGDAA